MTHSSREPQLVRQPCNRSATCPLPSCNLEVLRWIREAFAYARARHFKMLTYFDDSTFHWATRPGSLAWHELRRQLRLGL